MLKNNIAKSGVPACKCICTFFEKCNLNILKNVQKGKNYINLIYYVSIEISLKKLDKA